MKYYPNNWQAIKDGIDSNKDKIQNMLVASLLCDKIPYPMSEFNGEKIIANNESLLQGSKILTFVGDWISLPKLMAVIHAAYFFPRSWKERHARA